MGHVERSKRLLWAVMYGTLDDCKTAVEEYGYVGECDTEFIPHFLLFSSLSHLNASVLLLKGLLTLGSVFVAVVSVCSCNVHEVDEQGYVALHYAARRGESEMVEPL